LKGTIYLWISVLNKRRDVIHWIQLVELYYTWRIHTQKHKRNSCTIKLSVKSGDLGGENGQFRHNKASKWVHLGMKFLLNAITVTQTSFGGKLSFIPSFLVPERLHCCYIYFHCSYLYNCNNYSRTLCIKCWVSTFHIENFISLQISLKERG
jgi:hypothetical protein